MPNAFIITSSRLWQGKRQRKMKRRRSSRYPSCFCSMVFVVALFVSVMTTVLDLRIVSQKIPTNYRQATSATKSNYNDLENLSRKLNTAMIENQITSMNCGGRKCFVTLPDDDQNKNRIGYVIAQNNRIQRQISIDMNKAWDIAKTLHNKYNLSTLLLGPPEQLFTMSESFFEKLNSIQVQSDPGHFVNKNVKEWSSDDPLIIQATSIIPTPNFMWHINVYTSKENYRKPMVYADFISNHVQDINKFAKNLFSNLDSMKQFLNKNDGEYPCLLTDLQLIVDVEGNIHHVDLDRCYENTEQGIYKQYAYDIFEESIKLWNQAVKIAKSLG